MVGLIDHFETWFRLNPCLHPRSCHSFATGWLCWESLGLWRSSGNPWKMKQKTTAKQLEIDVLFLYVFTVWRNSSVDFKKWWDWSLTKATEFDIGVFLLKLYDENNSAILCTKNCEAKAVQALVDLLIVHILFVDRFCNAGSYSSKSNNVFLLFVFVLFPLDEPMIKLAFGNYCCAENTYIIKYHFTSYIIISYRIRIS